MTFDTFTNPDVHSAAQGMARKFEAAFAELQRYLTAELGKLDSEDGVIKSSVFNVSRIRNLLDSLLVVAREHGFEDLIRDQAQRLKDLADAVLREAGSHGMPEEFARTTGQALDLLARGAERDILATETVIARDLEELISRVALGGVRWDDLVRGIAERLGTSLKRAMTKATSTLAAFHTQARVSYFSEPEVEGGDPLVTWWLYDGPEDERNRDWCAHFIGTRVTLDILDEHAQDFGRDWPVLPRYSLGGPNCRHELIPLIDDFEQYPIGPK